MYFASADGQTQLVGYVFAPQSAGPHPRCRDAAWQSGPVFFQHQRRMHARCKGTTARLAMPRPSPAPRAAWGAHWADRGYLALLPGQFPGALGQQGPRLRTVHSRRPGPRRLSTSVIVRPLDGEGALKYLQSRKDVVSAHLPAGLVKRREHGVECHVPTSLPALRRPSRRRWHSIWDAVLRLDFAGLQVCFAGHGVPRF